MDVFEVRRQLIADYQEYTRSFVDIADPRIGAHVAERVDGGYQWPEPWLSLNPNFASGGTVTELVADGLLEPRCADFFWLPDGSPLHLHKHQREAIEVARGGHSYVLTTGTGSGKSLAYLIPIVDGVLRSRAAGTYSPGVKAIVVYPMNALANSQYHQLEKFLGAATGAVTFDRYTGQEREDSRRRILANPPDILLTNYVMAELVLTRPRERRDLISAASGLRFLVLDELHTYRGRQGADVALLVRRLREACDAPRVQCVGTSATMTTEGGPRRQQEVVADVATRMFGVDVAPEHVIGETLDQVTSPLTTNTAALAECVGAKPLGEYPAFVGYPLAAWVEQTLGFEDAAADVPRRRRTPLQRTQAADALARQTGLPQQQCADAIMATLQAGSRLRNPATGRPVFAFRLHQFLSKGDNVYVTLEPSASRYVTGKYQYQAPGDDPGAMPRLLFPVAFCRECGQEYLAVRRREDAQGKRFEARRDSDASGGDDNTGYLYLSEDEPWPATGAEAMETGRLPYSWTEADSSGHQEVLDGKQKYLPEPVWVSADGRVHSVGPDNGIVYAAYVQSPFRFCLGCRTSYEQARGSDFAKLAKLSAEGRSSATSVVSASIVTTLRSLGGELPPSARKLLAFVDNRQDASLQAGHFNDYVQVTQLRGALYRALAQRPDGLTHEVLAQQVTKALGLELADFAQAPGAARRQQEEAWRALREVTGFRLYLDLERGWRVTMPNLEQTGLLRISYPDLPDLAGDQSRWANRHPALRDADPAQRIEVASALLDELRRNLAIYVPCLTIEGFDPIKRLSQQYLNEPWSLPERESPPLAGAAFPGPGRAGRPRGDLYISGRGMFGRYLLRKFGGRPLDTPVVQLGTADAQQMIDGLFEVLDDGDVLKVVTGEAGVLGYRLKASAIRWEAGDGKSGAEDRLRRTLGDRKGSRVNPFFRGLYRSAAQALAGLHAKEHTAQVAPDERQKREDAFSADDPLPVLYCSPTMELGVDIKDLNVVALRNVPPTPANYTQRAGRAGRSGQPALVVTYCATGNAHDQYYFRKASDMVGGLVTPPRLDLANEDLIRSHVHAIWLAETAQDLHGSLPELLDTEGENPRLEIRDEIWQRLTDPAAAQQAIERASKVLSGLAPKPGHPAKTWWGDSWVADTVRQAPDRFRSACGRWTDMYRAALREYHLQTRLSVDISVRHEVRAEAQRRLREALVQLSLLRNEDSRESLTDFYSYRYFASEGFLPGYSFPRLPLAAYIPGLAGRRDGDYIQRPRFIGIREFGPGAVIYHEGARYQVVSAQLPAAGMIGDDIATSAARRCPDCGYLHDDAVGIDCCDHCNSRLRDTTRSLLRLTSVRTVRRDRISSDEEERRRSGFEVETSFRFAGEPNRAVAELNGSTVLEVTYGDSATIRRANLGLLRRKRLETRGYLIDVTNGRWLKESDEVPDQEDLPDVTRVRRPQRVIPYVADRRNILVTRLPARVDPKVAISVMIALERGIETAFQLEDSELESEQLPDPEQRGRALFVESAEGGAGVLRRLAEEPGALAKAAATALDVMHFNPETGDDVAWRLDERDPCVAACYQCLLSYGNQGMHEMIDRRLALDTLRELARAAIDAAVEKNESGGSGCGGQPTNEEATTRDLGTVDQPITAFVGWLRSLGLRLPAETGAETPEAKARPDLIYRNGDSKVAVFLSTTPQDRDAEDDLRDDGWSVARQRDGEDWESFAARFPSVFGRHPESCQ
jgi:ATP-dependent helicase YprA (DUF1998 family)